jgi:hypothetical protein
MTSRTDPVDARLLEVAKELLEMSESCAAHDPDMAAKFAQEAYEIGRSLGQVQALVARERIEAGLHRAGLGPRGQDLPLLGDDDAEEVLVRLLDRQRHVVAGALQTTTRRREPGNRRWWRW